MQNHPNNAELPLESSKVFQAVPAEVRAILAPEDLDLLLRLEKDFGFTFSQLKIFGQWTLDCRMWGESQFQQLSEAYLLNDLGEGNALPNPNNRRQIGERYFQSMQKVYADLAGKAKTYPSEGPRERLPAHKFQEKELKGKIFKLCPAASEKAVCCNLKVLNIVDNCAMACSYCVLQNHYDEATIVIPTNLKAKLAEIQLVPEKRYRIGTGEYSDSLLWGNRNDILADLCDFARANPNIILELKTKSANVTWLLENDVPANVCCSWSLNPQIIVTNEEHKTASLERRFHAARLVADKGIKVAFHIHPMFYFEGWDSEYQNLIARLMEMFKPEETLWVSLGCITMLKGFAQDFRLKFRHSKLLQMETEFTEDGKITYAFAVRERLYRNALAALKPWQGRVFQYLCMEHKPMWDAVMGYAYPNMGVFDDAFNDSVFSKLTNPTGIQFLHMEP